jgi:hypothetical protein
MIYEFILADIAKQSDIEAVVNSANANLRFGSGVAGAIHSAAGPELEDYCEPFAPLPFGDALLTPGFNLPNKFVIHVRAAHYLNDEEPWCRQNRLSSTKACCSDSSLSGLKGCRAPNKEEGGTRDGPCYQVSGKPTLGALP